MKHFIFIILSAFLLGCQDKDEAEIVEPVVTEVEVDLPPNSKVVHLQNTDALPVKMELVRYHDTIMDIGGTDEQMGIHFQYKITVPGQETMEFAWFKFPTTLFYQDYSDKLTDFQYSSIKDEGGDYRYVRVLPRLTADSGNVMTVDFALSYKGVTEFVSESKTKHYKTTIIFRLRGDEKYYILPIYYKDFISLYNK